MNSRFTYSDPIDPVFMNRCIWSGLNLVIPSGEERVSVATGISYHYEMPESGQEVEPVDPLMMHFAHKLDEFLVPLHRNGLGVSSLNQLYSYQLCDQSSYRKWKTKHEFDFITVSMTDFLTQEKFDLLADRWKKQIRGMSSMSRMMSDENYQKILTFGWNAVPFILRDFKKEVAPWFQALRAITDKRDIGREFKGQFRKIADAWIRWGEENGIIN